jgi:alpha-beta hydrolase superfamily lysophospholipase
MGGDQRSGDKPMKEGHFEGVERLDIFTRSWDPAAQMPRAMVVIVHGFNAHSGRYQWVGEQLTAKGIAVRALDLRGRGKSDGERFYVERFEDYEADVARFIGRSKTEYPGLPVFLLGHSAGGVVACLYALDHQAQIAGLICESFAHELPAPDFALAVLQGLAHIAPHVRVLKLKNEDFSRDAEVVKSMNGDALIAHEVQPSQTVAAMVHADERLKREFPRITLPVLILHGTHDKAAKPTGSQHFFEKAGSRDKTLKLYDGYFHDPLSDLGKEAVLADIQLWIGERIPTV